MHNIERDYWTSGKDQLKLQLKLNNHHNGKSIKMFLLRWINDLNWMLSDTVHGSKVD